MKASIFKPVIFVLAFLMFAGCTFNKRIKLSINETQKNEMIDSHDSSKLESSYYYYIEAWLQTKKGHPDKAIKYFNKAIELDPESLYLKKELTILLLREKKNEEALKVVESILEKNPEELNSLIIYGKIKQSLEQFDNARKTYEKILAINPKQQNIYILLGDLYMEKDDLDNAFRIYSLLVDNFPSSYVGHFFLGKIYLKKGNTDKAEKEFKKTLELEPELESPLFELISLYKAKNEKKKVIQTYKNILQKNPNNIGASIGLGCFYYKNGIRSRAEKIFKDLGIRSVNDSEVIKKLIHLYVEQNKHDAAIILLKGMLKAVPDFSDLHYIAGIIYDEKKDKNEAISHYKKVLPKTRFYKKAVIRLSFLYQLQGETDKAVNLLKALSKEIPDDSEPFLYLGLIFEQTGDFEEAEEVIRLDPENADALNYLGYTYAETGQNLDEAEVLIKKALKYKPDDGYIIDSLGWVYFKKGSFEKALKSLEKAVRLVPDDPAILEHLGDVYMKLNDEKNALKFYRRSFDLKKDDRSQLEKKIEIITDK